MPANSDLIGWRYKGVTKQHVKRAASLMDSGKVAPGFGASRDYFVIINGKRYPPKMVIAMAFYLATGRHLAYANAGCHGGWEGQVPNRPKRDTYYPNNYLCWLGFTVISKNGDRSQKKSKSTRASSSKAMAQFEGAELTVMRNMRERSRKARQLCIETHGTRCACCGVCLDEVYGDIATGYIQVHHLSPLRNASSRRRVDPASDLCPVCPNCHVVLHMKRPEFSIKELQEIIKNVERRRRRLQQT